MTPEKEAMRGEEAKRLLENELYREAFDMLNQSIISKWLAAPIRDREGMHELKLMAKVLQDVESYLAQIVNTGKMAEMQLEQEAKVAKLRKAGIR